jgi:hypothetical protein
MHGRKRSRKHGGKQRRKHGRKYLLIVVEKRKKAEEVKLWML